MKFEKFKKEYLLGIGAFYPSFDAWFLYHTNAKTTEEYEQAQKEGRLEEISAKIGIIKR